VQIHLDYPQYHKAGVADFLWPTDGVCRVLPAGVAATGGRHGGIAGDLLSVSRKGDDFV